MALEIYSASSWWTIFISLTNKWRVCSWVSYEGTVYMETYVDLSWGPVVSCLSTRTGMLGCCFSHSSNSAKFCCQFDTTYFNQKHWKVEDPRLHEGVSRWGERCAKGLSQLIRCTLRDPGRFGDSMSGTLLRCWRRSWWRFLKGAPGRSSKQVTKHLSSTCDVRNTFCMFFASHFGS